MKHILCILAFAAGTILPGVGLAAPNTPALVASPSTVVEHGGGCRKSSPPGQCCHKDNSTGRVHCH